MLGGGSVLAGLALLYPVQAGAEGLFLLPAALFLLGATAIIFGLLGLRRRLAAATPTLPRIGGPVVLGFTGLTVVALLVIGILTLLGAGLGLNVPEASRLSTLGLDEDLDRGLGVCLGRERRCRVVEVEAVRDQTLGADRA